MYAKVKNGVVEKYPYTDEDIRSDNSNVTFPSALTDDTRREWGATPVMDTPPAYNPQHQKLEVKDSSEWEVRDGSVHVVYDILGIPLGDRKQDMISHIEAKRWDVEVGGMSFNSVIVPTDDRSKTLILGARTAALEQGDDYYDEWKISPGVYIPLDAASAIALGDALLAHIRASFAREKALSLAVLAAEDHDALDLVEAEINNDWPV